MRTTDQEGFNNEAKMRANEKTLSLANGRRKREFLTLERETSSGIGESLDWSRNPECDRIELVLVPCWKVRVVGW